MVRKLYKTLYPRDKRHMIVREKMYEVLLIEQWNGTRRRWKLRPTEMREQADYDEQKAREIGFLKEKQKALEAATPVGSPANAAPRRLVAGVTEADEMDVPSTVRGPKLPQLKSAEQALNDEREYSDGEDIYSQDEPKGAARAQQKKKKQVEEVSEEHRSFCLAFLWSRFV
jgi:hypothetical protein